MSSVCGAATGKTLRELLECTQNAIDRGYEPIGGICFTGKLFVWGMLGEAEPELITFGKLEKVEGEEDVAQTSMSKV